MVCGEHLARCMVYIDTNMVHEKKWTGSIAVVNRPFFERVKELLGFRAKGKKIIESKEGYQVRDLRTCSLASILVNMFNIITGFTYRGLAPHKFTPPA